MRLAQGMSLWLGLSLVACSTNAVDLNEGAGGSIIGGKGGAAGKSTGGSSGSSGQGGVAGTTGGAGGADAGAAGDAGQGGEGGAAGDTSTAGAGPGGSDGSAGDGGSAGGGAGDGGGAGGPEGGASGSSGQAAGGSAGSGGGSGGSGQSGAAGAAGGGALVVVASATSGDAFGAVFASGAWSGQGLGAALVGRPAVSASGATAFVVGRHQGDGVLWSGTWSAGTFSALAQVGSGIAADAGPSLSIGGQAGWVTYQRAGKHYAATFTSMAPGAEGPLGSDMAQAFGPSTSSVLTVGTKAYAVYAGQDNGLYAVEHNGTAWGTSSGIVGAGSKSDITPTLVADDQGQPTVLFVRKENSQISVATLGSTGWSAPEVIPDVFTSRSPAAATLADGSLLVSWHGLDSDNKLYAITRAKGGGWSSVTTIDANSDNAASSAPAVTAGVSGDAGEVVYVRGGQLLHVRHGQGSFAQPQAVPGATSLVDVGAAAIVAP